MMVQFTEQAYGLDECLDKIREKYGERFTILNRKTVRLGGFLGLFTREGIEVTGYIPNRYEKAGSGLMTFQGMGLGAAPAMSAASSAVTGTSVPPLDFEEERRKILAANGKDLTMQQVLSTVQEIKEKIDQGAPAVQPEDHPNIKRLQECFELNDFSSGYQEKIISRIKKECSLDTLEDYDALQDTVLEWIGGASIFTGKSLPPLGVPGRPGSWSWWGPTGVGKTTTIAKLAAVFGVGRNDSRPLSVRMVTIDNYRIGASYQIEKYGGIMEIPVSSVKGYRELKEVIALNAEEVDLILIDTIGKSPRASIELAEMKQILDACGSSAEFQLVLSATTKSSDISEILTQFEPFAYRSVLITKMDETIRLGNVISALADRGKSISYITDGQKVPDDIQKAEVIRFLINLEGFKINRAKIEKRFPNDKSDFIQWRQ